MRAQTLQDVLRMCPGSQLDFPPGKNCNTTKLNGVVKLKAEARVPTCYLMQCVKIRFSLSSQSGDNDRYYNFLHSTAYQLKGQGVEKMLTKSNSSRLVGNGDSPLSST